MPACCAYNEGMEQNTHQYTVRGVPQRVDEALRRKAKQQGASLNQTVLEAITHGLGLTDDAPVYHDLDDLAGTWVEDPAFDEAIDEMDSVDPDLWS